MALSCLEILFLESSSSFFSICVDVQFLYSGLSMNVFNQWGQYLKFALPSMLGVCVECWYYEIATVAIGTLGNTQLAVMSIIKQISEIIYMVCVHY